MNPSILKFAASTAATMIGFTVVGTALLAFTANSTKDIISKNVEQEKMVLISQTLPQALYDNNLVQDALVLQPDDKLGNDEPSFAYPARLQGKTMAVVLEVIAPDGYSGKINLLVAILNSGEIAGVRVVSHNETPGLGDYIDIAKSPWITHFDHTSLERIRPQDWKVKKDGGQFDSMAGATITPRALVKAVYKALQYFEKNKNKLLAAHANSAGA